jgi:hypothetical protein
MKHLILLFILSIIVPAAASAEPLITRVSRIKENEGKYYAVVPFYQWYLDKLFLTKDDFQNAQYPIKTKFGVAEPYLQRFWGQKNGDGRVKLSITYQNIPTEDVIKINGKEILIKYVSDSEFIKSQPSGLKKVP